MSTEPGELQRTILTAVAGAAGILLVVAALIRAKAMERSVEVSQKAMEMSAQQTRERLDHLERTLELSQEQLARTDRTLELNERNFELAQETLKLAQETHAATVAGNISDRFIKSSEQLSSDSFYARTGAIAALSQIAKDSQEEFFSVVDVLTNFVRQRSGEDRIKLERQVKSATDDGPPAELIEKMPSKFAETLSSPEFIKTMQEIRGPLDDVALAVTSLLEARSSCNRPVHVNAPIVLNYCYLPGINLSGHSLNNVFFYGADLRFAVFEKCDVSAVHFHFTNLGGARLENSIGLQEEQLAHALVDDDTRLPAGVKAPPFDPSPPK